MQAEATITAPRVVRIPWQEAHELAESENEPVFVPVQHYCDDRGWSLMNLLAGAMSDKGQVNFSVQYPGVVKAWHRHQNQTDFWCCLLGHIKVGIYRDDDDQKWSLVIGEKRPGVVVIPRTVWHGAATVGSENAGLWYYMDQIFDPNAPDEERRPWDSVPGFQWGVEHR